MGERTCIVTRNRDDRDGALIRFVRAPDGTVTPDLKRNLPGRGCWVSADRAVLAEAVRRKLFSRALKAETNTPADLPDQVDALLGRAALGAIGLARKAGALALGAAKVDAAVRSGKAQAVLHATDGAADGVRKIDSARRSVVHLGGPRIGAYKLFSGAEMGLALGTTNVIHAALLQADAGRAALRRVELFARYRGLSSHDGLPAGESASEEEME